MPTSPIIRKPDQLIRRVSKSVLIRASLWLALISSTALAGTALLALIWQALKTMH